MPPLEPDALRASIVVNGLVLNDEAALAATTNDLRRALQQRATAAGRVVVDEEVKVEDTRQPPVRWWQALVGNVPPRLYRLVVEVRTDPFD